MTSTTVAKAVYERLEQELTQERSNHGLELAAIEKRYQERIAKLERDIDTYKDVGKHYEAEITRLEAMLSNNAEKQKLTLAKLVDVTQELKACKRDMIEASNHGDGICVVCKKYKPDFDCDMECYICEECCACFQCEENKSFEWRGLCEENGGDTL